MEKKNDNLKIRSVTETKLGILDGLKILLGRKVVKSLVVEVTKEGKILNEKVEIKVGSKSKPKPSKVEIETETHLIELGAGNYTFCGKEFIMTEKGWSEKFTTDISQVSCMDCCNQYEFIN
jgi:hypothetical protein